MDYRQYRTIILEGRKTSKVNLQLPRLTAWKHLPGQGMEGRTQAKHSSLTEQKDRDQRQRGLRQLESVAQKTREWEVHTIRAPEIFTGIPLSL